jgi:TonB-linked SusC/RagA family outer membrane protein
MYLYTISHASFGAGLLNYDCPNASAKSLIRWCMRIFLLSALLTFNLMLLGKDSNSQTLDKVIISLNVKDVTLKQVFNKIEKQTSFHFTYRSDDVRRIKAITYTQDKVSLAKALDDLLQNTGLRYEEMDKNILILQTGSPLALGIVNVQPDTAIVRGKVTNENGEPLVGATVTIQGQNKSVTTNNAGEFRMANTKPGKYNVTVTYVGYQALNQEVIIREEGTTDLALSLQKLTANMEEVVVIGYGTKKKENLTGAVSTVTSEVLKSRPITNTYAGIQGEVPGLSIQRSSGQPGVEGYGLTVRGASTTNGGNAAQLNPLQQFNIGGASLSNGGNSPLVLIDGVAGNLDLLNPDDIESISVLKDAAASIYGARAAGGVMLVTTKKGKKGAAMITYSGNAAITKMSGMMKSPDNYQFALMENEANIHNGAAPMYTPELLEKVKNNDPNPIPHPLYGGWMLFFTNTNWIDAVIGDGFQQKHYINVSGGGNNSTYYLSGGYSKENGVIKYAPDNNERYNLRMNYDYDFSKRIRLETKVSFEDQKRTDVGGIGSSGIITEAIFGMPNHPVYTQDGKNFFAQGGWGNAVAQAKEGAKATFNTRNINTNFKLIVDVLKDLKLNLQAGINQSTQDNTDIAKAVPLYKWDNSSIQYYTIANPDQASLTRTSYNSTYQNFTGYFQYSKKFNDRHDIDIMGGASYEYNNYDLFNTSRDHFSTDEVWSINLGGTQNMSSSEKAEHWAIGSVFSRLSYTYNNKYLLEANLRYDGSSRFQSDSRWGFFPGVSVAWRLGQENFIKDLGVFNDLKLRASYGQTGNQEGIGLYDYLQLINIGSRPYSYPFGAGSQTQSASLAGMVSLNRTWETLINKNIGIDATLFSNKLDVSFDYFIKRNKNMLIPVTYPSMLGAVPPFSNSGELKTWGFETAIGWKDKIGNVKYSVRLIMSDAQNKVVNYGGQDTYVLGLNTLTYWWDPNVRQGDALDTYYGYVFDGVIRNQKQLDDYKKLGGVPSDIKIGDAMFKDLNGDGKISLYGDKPGDNGDVKNLGSLTPRYNFGINISVSYKNFDIGIFAQGVAKRTIFREGDYAIPWSAWWRQPPVFYFGKTWNEDRPNAPYPELSFGSINYWNYQPSTLQKINAAYIRLKNLQVGYTFSSGLMKRLSISKARIYFSGQDLWELDGVKGGWDPEASTSGFNYPFQRFYSAGIDVTF